jgi:hypothetical protein
MKLNNEMWRMMMQSMMRSKAIDLSFVNLEKEFL